MKANTRILVVDDDVDTVEQLSLHLGQAGFEVLAAHGEAEAEEILSRVKPDVAVVDLMMEEMDSGFALAHRLKTLYPDTPVILLTAVAAETGLHFGVTTADEQAWIKADTFMDKPVRPEQLKGEIERLLRRQEPPRFPVAGAPSAERHKG